MKKIKFFKFCVVRIKKKEEKEEEGCVIIIKRKESEIDRRIWLMKFWYFIFGMLLMI